MDSEKNDIMTLIAKVIAEGKTFYVVHMLNELFF